METHQPDPTSPGEPDPWDTVSSEFSSLGDRLRETYHRVASEGGPSEDEIKDALATLVGAWNQVAASFSAALNDPETRDHLKKAASSFAAALGATITDLGDEIKSSSFTGDRVDQQPVGEDASGGGVDNGGRQSTPLSESGFEDTHASEDDG